MPRDAEPTANLPARVPLATEAWGVLKSFQVARRNLVEIIPAIALRQPIVSGRTAIVRWHMVMDPASNRHILKDALENYPKSIVTKNILRPAIGESLFIAEGQHWHWQRRAAAPVFSARNIRNLGPIMTAAAERASDRVEAAVGRAANLFEEMVTATYEVISDVTFSGGDGFGKDDVHRAIDSYIAQAGRVSLLDVIGAPDWIPRPSRVFTSATMRDMKRVADEAIEARQEKGAREVPDLLDLLLDGEDPKTKRRMTTEEVRDNLLAFIVAGHETTALTLAWALYLLAFDPAVQTRARAEAQSVLDGRAATADDVEKLPFIRQVVDETLRLYPPAAIVSRTAQAPDTLCGREVRPGDTVMLPFYALHRNHLLWDDPHAFRPERFADPKAIDRFAYLPFGDGPRICIGASFAIQEAVIILATLISRFRFSLVPGKAPKPVLILTLRPDGGVWLTVERAGPEDSAKAA